MGSTIVDEVIIDTTTHCVGASAGQPDQLTEAEKKVLNDIYKKVIQSSNEMVLPQSIKKDLHHHWLSSLRFE